MKDERIRELQHISGELTVLVNRLRIDRNTTASKPLSFVLRRLRQVLEDEYQRQTEAIQTGDMFK